jgi:multidrug efflux pump subunit AcrB
MTEQLRNYVAQKQASLADGVYIVGWIDESRILRGRINLMLTNAAQGGLLVVIALALFLDLSLALWVVMGIPFAVMATLATIYFFDLPISINVLSVFAFILVLGILVDDGIVTAESAYAICRLRIRASPAWCAVCAGCQRRRSSARLLP